MTTARTLAARAAALEQRHFEKLPPLEQARALLAAGVPLERWTDQQWCAFWHSFPEAERAWLDGLVARAKAEGWSDAEYMRRVHEENRHNHFFEM